MTAVYVEIALLFRNVDVAMLIVGENVGFQSKFFACVRFEVNEQIAVRLASSVDIRLYHMFRVTRVHLSRQMSDLRFVSHIFEENQVLRV